MGAENVKKTTGVLFPTLRRAIFLLLAMAGLVLSSGGALAESPDIRAATLFAETVENTSLKFVTDTKVPRAERAERVREVFARDFNLDAIGRFALGTRWHAATDKQRREYMELFEKALVNQYTVRLEDFEGMTIKAITEKTSGSRDFIISREAHHTDGMIVSMEWRIRAENNGMFKIVDLTVAGISMGVTLRGEFTEIIQRGGGNVDALLYALRKRNKRTMVAQNQ